MNPKPDNLPVVGSETLTLPAVKIIGVGNAGDSLLATLPSQEFAAAQLSPSTPMPPRSLRRPPR